MINRLGQRRPRRGGPRQGGTGMATPRQGHIRKYLYSFILLTVFSDLSHLHFVWFSRLDSDFTQIQMWGFRIMMIVNVKDEQWSKLPWLIRPSGTCGSIEHTCLRHLYQSAVSQYNGWNSNSSHRILVYNMNRPEKNFFIKRINLAPKVSSG